MKYRVLGAGWYGCHIATELIARGHEVVVWDTADKLFAGASGNIPARLHLGFHYPRSRMTRAACQEHVAEFMASYGELTRGVPVNIYAVAAERSLVDFDQYVRTLRGEVDFVVVDSPAEYGLQNVEGAVLTGERHIVTRLARQHFAAQLAGKLLFGQPEIPIYSDDPAWNWTIDCTFAANGAAGVDRYEPCVVVLLRSARADKAVTIMDGPFGSLYPWDEGQRLSSLSSAKHTPFSKSCKTYAEARALLDGLRQTEIIDQGERMFRDFASFYPEVLGYEVIDHMVSIRAQPASGADTRLVDVAPVGERTLAVRAGKIDAVIHAAREVIRRTAA